MLPVTLGVHVRRRRQLSTSRAQLHHCVERGWGASFGVATVRMLLMWPAAARGDTRGLMRSTCAAGFDWRSHGGENLAI